MTRERKSLIAGVGVLIFTVILAGVAVTAHNNNEPQPEWLMVMNAETGEFQPASLARYGAPLDVWGLACVISEYARGVPLYPGSCSPDKSVGVGPVART